MGDPWTDEEERDFQEFLASLDERIEDPDLLAFLAPGGNGEFLDLVYELPESAGCCAGFGVLQ